MTTKNLEEVPSKGLVALIDRGLEELEIKIKYMARILHASDCKNKDCTFDSGKCQKRKDDLRHVINCGCVKNNCTRAYKRRPKCSGPEHKRCDYECDKSHNCSLTVELIAHHNHCTWSLCPMCRGAEMKKDNIDADIRAIYDRAFAAVTEWHHLVSSKYIGAFGNLRKRRQPEPKIDMPRKEKSITEKSMPRTEKSIKRSGSDQTIVPSYAESSASTVSSTFVDESCILADDQDVEEEGSSRNIKSSIGPEACIPVEWTEDVNSKYFVDSSRLSTSKTD